MKNIFFAFMLLATTTHAQLGVSLSTSFNDANDWNKHFFDQHYFLEEKSKMFETSYEINLGYLFHLPNYRIDFYPNLGYSRAQNSSYYYLASPSENYLADFNFHQYNISLMTKIYPLDFKSKNQATVIKSNNNVLKKGLFLIFNPSISIINMGFSYELPNANISQNTYQTYRLGYGIGFDFGIHKNLTISPFAMWHSMNAPNHTIVNFFQEAFPQSSPILLDEKTTFRQVQLGVQILFGG